MIFRGLKHQGISQPWQALVTTLQQVVRGTQGRLYPWLRQALVGALPVEGYIIDHYNLPTQWYV